MFLSHSNMNMFNIDAEKVVPEKVSGFVIINNLE